MRTREHHIKQSIPYRVVSDMVGGPIDSILHYKDIHHKQPSLPEQPPQLSDTPQVLTKIFTRLEKESELGGLNSQYDTWNTVRTLLQDQIGGAYTITDYVSFEPLSNTFTLFLKTKSGTSSTDSTLVPLILTGDDLNPDKLKQQLADQRIKAILHQSPDWTTTENRVLPPSSALAEMEQGIRNIHKTRGIEEKTVVTHRLSRIANTHELRRHVDFDRDGGNTRLLRNKRVYTIGEMQELQRYLFSHGLTFDGATGSVTTETNLTQRWIEMRKYAGIDEEQAVPEMEKYARECIYYRMVMQYFKDCPDEAYAFMNSSVFRKYEEQFKNVHFAAYGQTEMAVAQSMMANFFLMQFEGVKKAEDSPSQKLMDSDGNYDQEFTAYIKGREELQLLLPEVTDPVIDQPKGLKNLYKKAPYDITPVSPDDPQFQKVIADADTALEKIPNEIRRQETGLKIRNKIKPHINLIEVEGQTARLFPIAVGYLGLAKAGKKYVAANWLNRSGEYMPQGKDLVPFGEVTEPEPVEKSIKHIFNGEVHKPDDKTTESAYESQVERIQEEGGNILKFLKNDPRVPNNVKLFMAEITSESVISRIMEQFGPVTDQDPNVVNRFYDTVAEFQLSIVYRYVNDFLRGVETEIVNRTQPLIAKIARKTFADWNNNDFSKVPAEIVRAAIDQTLAYGEHRIKKLNHETDENITLKDKQEFLERLIGPRTYDMRYLSHDNYMNIWKTLGGAWDCICFSRKTVFNPNTLKQY